jgi:type VI secretion system ImpA/VasJ family protein
MIENLLKDNINDTIGEDVKYTDDYLMICEEISNLNSLEFNKEIDFEKIISLSKSILENESKDITVSVYLSIALSKEEDILGFSSSIQIIKDMLAKFGMELYPKNNVAKFNAFFWWINKIIPILSNIQNPCANLNQNIYDDIFSNLKFIDNFVNTNFEEKISFNEIFAFLNTKLVLIEKKEESKNIEKKEESKNIEKKEVSKNIEKKEVSKNINIESLIDDGNRIYLESIFNILLKDLNNISQNIIKNNNFNIYLFLINRIKLWFDIEEVPTNNMDVTYIKAPESHEFEYLNSLYKEQNWNELLVESESKIFAYPFWLDLHFYVYVSLKHKQIKDIHIYSDFIKNFINKFPKLIHFKFENELSFANSSTKLWLNEILNEKNHSKKNTKKDINLQKGYELVSNNQIIESIKFFLDEVNKSSTKRDEVLIIIELVNIIKDYKYYDLTYHYLDYLHQITIDYKLYDWESDLAVKIYKLIINSNKTINYDIDALKLNKIKKSLAVLDLEAYIEISNS